MASPLLRRPRRLQWRLVRLRRVGRLPPPACPVRSLAADCEALCQELCSELARQAGDADLIPQVLPQVLPPVVARVAPAAVGVVGRHGWDRVIDFLTDEVVAAFRAVVRKRDDAEPYAILNEYLARLFYPPDERYPDELRDLVSVQLRARRHRWLYTWPERRDLLFSLLALRVAAEIEVARHPIPPPLPVLELPASELPASEQSGLDVADPVGQVRAGLEHEPLAGYPNRR